MVGTSAGSVVAALYASGKTPAELAALADAMDETALTDWSYPGRGVIRGDALARFVRNATGGRTIDQMKLPLGIVATDLDSGSAILFRRGDTATAVRASSAVPAVFQPVKIGSREYVDGGLVAPVPVRFAREMGAELVIAVDISSPPEGALTGDAMRMLLQTFSIMSRSINNFELRDADIVLRPSLPGVSSADFSSRQRSIQAGRAAALAALPELREDRREDALTDAAKETARCMHRAVRTSRSELREHLEDSRPGDHGRGPVAPFRQPGRRRVPATSAGPRRPGCRERCAAGRQPISDALAEAATADEAATTGLTALAVACWLALRAER